VCLLLLALWVRSYWRTDLVALRTSEFDFGVESVAGGTTVSLFLDSTRTVDSEMFYESYSQAGWFERHNETWTFHLVMSRTGFNLSLPHWFYLALTGAIAVAAWIGRFSLRTFLITVTLLALILGLIIATTR
jgi:hypothetical protein